MRRRLPINLLKKRLIRVQPSNQRRRRHQRNQKRRVRRILSQDIRKLRSMAELFPEVVRRMSSSTSGSVTGSPGRSRMNMVSWSASSRRRSSSRMMRRKTSRVTDATTRTKRRCLASNFRISMKDISSPTRSVGIGHFLNKTCKP